MIGSQIIFGKYGKPVFDWTGVVSDFDATVQNAMVYLGTESGSNGLYLEQGTPLLLNAARSSLVNTSAAQAACNLAANRVLLFSQQNNGRDTDRLAKLTLEVSSQQGQQMWVGIQAIAQSGKMRGVTSKL